MRRASDSDSRLIFRVDRFVQQNGEWFYMTRDGQQRGPFKSKAEAEGDLVFYLFECHKKKYYHLD